jgi:hypothetical protein
MAAAAPSRTAAATCFVLPWRASPAAKTPAQLVSKALAACRRPGAA